ncbi:hypothetical protein RyT2_02530 [Pseudolactococcus yaeyamensis]
MPDALKNNFKIEEKGGFITSIDGKVADKGAADIQLKKGDWISLLFISMTVDFCPRLIL